MSVHYQWQAKHLRWYLDRACADLAPTTRYDRWRTIRSLAVALGAWMAGNISSRDHG